MPWRTRPTVPAGGDHTICVSGNDAVAKAEVSRLLAEWFGWRDIIDLGDITTACGTPTRCWSGSA